MIFTLEALAAKQGDCLILHYGSPDAPRHVLIDGGPAGVYTQSLRPRLAALKGDRKTLPIELVMVSHIDDDHIHGIIDFVKALSEEDAEPPYSIRTIWHNSFDKLIERTAPSMLASPDVASVARGVVPAALGASPMLHAVAASVDQGNTLKNLARKMSVPLNTGAHGDLVLSAAPTFPRVTLAGGLSLDVVGPQQPEIDNLRAEWLKGEASGHAKTAAFVADYLNRTVTNLSSIVVLAELQVDAGRTRRMLLTGDAGGDLIMQALSSAGKLDGTPFHVDLLKVQHHGSQHSVDEVFFKRVTADHYVFSGNGKHENPHGNTLQWLSHARAGEPYDAYLTYRTGEEGLTATLDAFLAAEAASQPQHRYHFREAAAPSIEVKLGSDGA